MKATSKTPVPLIKSHSHTLAAVGALATGTLFGISLCKSQVFRPDIIQGQLTMQNFTMMKMFLSAAAVSTGSIQWMAGQKWISLSQPAASILKSIAGGAILGCGMYIAGACPGTVLAQIGPGVKTAQQTLIGGVLGAFAFGVFDRLISGFFEKKNNPPTVDSALNISSGKAAVIITAALCGMLGLLEYIRPWQIDAGVPLSVPWYSASLFSNLWSPYFGGAMIGLLQIPSFFLINGGLGCSSGYVSLISNIFGKNILKNFEYFKAFYGTTASVWQLFLDLGIIIGAALCYQVISPNPPKFSFTTPYAMLGGFLLIFGARLANGCTSGHGLTGIGKLSLNSMVAVAGMFGGGMLTALIASRYL